MTNAEEPFGSTQGTQPFGSNAENIAAAMCYLRVALAHIDPDSPEAAAPVKEPPSDWPYAASEWTPDWGGPEPNLKQADTWIELTLTDLSNV